jgi:hypothetical protein
LTLPWGCATLGLLYKERAWARAVLRRPFGTCLTAVVALLGSRYRLSRQEVRRRLQELWQVRVSRGAVVRQEPRPSRLGEGAKTGVACSALQGRKRG